MGGLVLVNAAIADGPFGAFRWVSRRRHRWADWAVLGAMVVLTVLPGIDLSSRLVQGSLVVVFAVVIFGTNYTEPVKKKEVPTGPSGKATEFSRQAGRMSGQLAARIRHRDQRKTDHRT
jgi:uncharacterized membrane protein YfcA